MCATHNITRSTKTIIIRELKRGGEITDKIMSGKLSWKDLFEKHTFFTQGYKYYLSIIAASTTENAQLVWAGSVESKVRHLVAGLEDHASIALAHPFNKGFERVHKCENEEEVEKAKSNLQFQVKEIQKETISKLPNGEVTETAKGDQKVNVAEGTVVYTTTWYVGLELREGKFSPLL